MYYIIMLVALKQTKYADFFFVSRGKKVSHTKKPLGEDQEK